MADESTPRKRLGQFYTPVSEAASLANWAIRTGAERILEPSAGDGALLAPALERAAALFDRPPVAIAVDIDNVATATLHKKFGAKVRVITDDFFNQDIVRINAVDVILANPPFSRNQQIPPETRADLRQRFPVKGAAGLWVYFTLHARQFLRPGGRMAIVVPGAACFANYAKDLLSQLQADFKEVGLYELPTKPDWIGGAEERGALLLAEGWQGGPAQAVKRGVWSYELDAPRPLRDAPPPPSFSRLMKASQPLSDLANMSIGIVTGANRVFLLSAAEAKAASLKRSDLRPIVTRSRQARSLIIRKRDLAAARMQPEKVWLLNPKELGPKGGPVRRRLALISPKTRRSTSWLNKRDPWWRIHPLPTGDAVFTYMNDRGPRICLLEEGLLCTNTLHSLTFLPAVSQEEKWAATLSMISTFGQLAAESRGRSYGGGVLKFELHEARAFPTLPSSALVTAARFNAVDEALRCGDSALAQEIADEVLISPLLGGAWRSAVAEMQIILKAAQASRRRGDARSREVDDNG